MVFSAEGKFKHKKNMPGMSSTKLDYCHDPTQTVTPKIKTVITKNDNYPPTIDRAGIEQRSEKESFRIQPQHQTKLVWVTSLDIR